MTAHHPPVLAVDDVERAIGWWCDLLGFAVSFRNRHPTPEDDPNFAVVERDDVEIHLARRSELSDTRRSEITIFVADLAGIVDELDDRGATPARLPTHGVAVRDPDGNRVVFRQAAGQDATRSA